MSAKMNIPELRFAEFRENLKEKKLGDLGIFKGGGTPSTSNEKYWVGNIPWISSSDIIEQDIYNINIAKYINDISLKESATKIIPKNSILFVSRVGVGKLAVNKVDLCTSQDFTNLTLNNENNSYFIAYYFLTKNNLLIRYSQGTSIKGFTTNDIKTIKLNLPSKLEQEKIASFLSSVDAKIEQLSKKKKLLQEYKKGAMQKIFSLEIRFKDDDGREYPEWVEKKLGEISIITMGQSPDSKSYNDYKDGMFLIQGNADIKNRKTNPRQWTNEPTKTCEIGDLILTVRAPVGAIAKSLHNACIGRGVCAIKNNNLSNIEFLYQHLLSYEARWISLEQGSTFTAVNSNDIKSLKINLPSLKEQTKIANFLSSIDAKIELSTKELDATKEFKKALLQKMFV